MTMSKTKISQKSMEIAINLIVIMAIVSQFIMPKMVSANIEAEMANSTQKMIDIEIDEPESISLPKLAKPEIKTKTTPKKVASKTSKIVDGPGESVKLALAEDEKPDRVMTAVISAYNSVPGQTDDSPFIAATGKRVHDSMIAANGMPFGTKIRIPKLFGDKVFVVEDRMNSRYGFGRMDIWMSEVVDARQFGVKRVEVEIYYPKKAVVKADR